MGVLSTTYVLSRVGMVVCSALLLLNTAEVISLRNSALPVHDLVEQWRRFDPLNSSLEVIKFDIERVKLSKWLGLHVWPVPLWLLFAFLQTTAVIRRKYLNLHRWVGRVFLLLSLYMTFGYTMMMVTGEPLLGKDRFSVDFKQPSNFFTFRSATIMNTVWWFVSGIKAYRYAKRKNIKLHKYWAWQFLGTGLSVGTMRVFMAVVLLGWYRRGGGNVYEKHFQDVLSGYSAWLGFVVSTLAAHVVVGAEIARAANANLKAHAH